MLRDRDDVLDPEQLPFGPDEPDDDPGEDDVPMHSTSASSSVQGGDREWEFKTFNLSLAEVADGSTLVARLAEAATDDWHLAEVIDAGETRVLLLRRPRKRDREKRHVGFAPPAR